MARAWTTACCVVVLTACSNEPIANSPKAPVGDPVTLADENVLRVRIVDTDSAPLAGMVPVAAEGPSLLSKTVAEGSMTGLDGLSQLAFPKDTWVYVRATDPKGDVVATNYVEIQPGDSPESDEPVDLLMGATATVTASLRREDGTPVVNQAVQFMMIHPAHGKWWHVEGATDELGDARFTGLPAGVYALRLEFLDGTAAMIREVVLSEREVKDLGVVPPQPIE